MHEFIFEDSMMPTLFGCIGLFAAIAGPVLAYLKMHDRLPDHPGVNRLKYWQTIAVVPFGLLLVQICFTQVMGMAVTPEGVSLQRPFPMFARTIPKAEIKEIAVVRYVDVKEDQSRVTHWFLTVKDVEHEIVEMGLTTQAIAHHAVNALQRDLGLTPRFQEQINGRDNRKDSTEDAVWAP